MQSVSNHQARLRRTVIAAMIGALSMAACASATAHSVVVMIDLCKEDGRPARVANEATITTLRRYAAFGRFPECASRWMVEDGVTVAQLTSLREAMRDDASPDTRRLAAEVLGSAGLDRARSLLILAEDIEQESDPDIQRTRSEKIQSLLADAPAIAIPVLVRQRLENWAMFAMRTSRSEDLRASAIKLLGALSTDAWSALRLLEERLRNESDLDVQRVQLEVVSSIVSTAPAWNGQHSLHALIDSIVARSGQQRKFGQNADEVTWATMALHNAQANVINAIMLDLLRQQKSAKVLDSDTAFQSVYGSNPIGKTGPRHASTREETLFALFAAYQAVLADASASPQVADSTARIATIAQLRLAGTNLAPTLRLSLDQMLFTSMKNKQDQVRAAATAAIVALGEASLKDASNATLDSMRLQAAQANETYLGALLSVQTDSTPAVRMEATRGLGLYASTDKRAMDSLIDALDDSSWEVTAAATTGLGRVPAIPERAIAKLFLHADSLAAVSILNRNPSEASYTATARLLIRTERELQKDRYWRFSTDGGRDAEIRKYDDARALNAMLKDAGQAAIIPLLLNIDQLDEKADRDRLYLRLLALDWLGYAKEHSPAMVRALEGAPVGRSHFREFTMSLMARLSPYATLVYSDTVAETLIADHLDGATHNVIHEQTAFAMSPRLPDKRTQSERWEVPPQQAAVLIAGNSKSPLAAAGLIRWMCSGWPEPVPEGGVTITFSSDNDPSPPVTREVELESIAASLRRMGSSAAVPLIEAVAAKPAPVCARTLNRLVKDLRLAPKVGHKSRKTTH